MTTEGEILAGESAGEPAAAETEPSDVRPAGAPSLGATSRTEDSEAPAGGERSPARGRSTPGLGRLRRATARPRRRLRARRVERIVRRFDPWSVMKLSFLFLLCLWLIFLLAGVILWNAAERTGAIEKIEDFITELFALESFRFESGQLLRGSAVGGFILVLVGTGFSVLLSVLFNLISDLTGGIRASVVELENLRLPPERSGDAPIAAPPDLQPSVGGPRGEEDGGGPRAP